MKYVHARFDQLNSTADAIQRGLGYSLNSDMRLSAYNIVPLNAPIAIACRDANIKAAFQLFKAGRVTFHDRIVSIKTSQKISLIDYTWSHFMNTIEVINTNGLQKLLHDKNQMARLKRDSEMIKFLVAAIDPSDRNLIAYTFIGDVWELIAEEIFHDEVTAAYFQEVVRVFLSQRRGCPFCGPRKSQQEFLRQTASIFRDIAASPKEEHWEAQSARIIAKPERDLTGVAAPLATNNTASKTMTVLNWQQFALLHCGTHEHWTTKSERILMLQTKERLKVYLKHGNLIDMRPLCHTFGEADKIELLKLAWGEAGREPKDLHEIMVKKRLV